MNGKLNIQKAKRYQKKAKIALIGPSGSGKTMTGLKLLRGLVGEKGRMLVLDSERSSATLYADNVEFDHADLPDTEYETYMQSIEQAKELKYDGLLIDSASHAWESFLELHDQESARTRNSFTAWAKITPKYNALINAIISYPGHCIVTMRAKTDYVIEKNEKGKDTPKKVGLAAVMRPGVEYEFDVVGLIDIDHNMLIEKTRFDWLADKFVKKPDEKMGKKLAEWLSGGSAPMAKTEAPKAEVQKVEPLKSVASEPEDVPQVPEPEVFVYNLLELGRNKKLCGTDEEKANFWFSIKRDFKAVKSMRMVDGAEIPVALVPCRIPGLEFCLIGEPQESESDPFAGDDLPESFAA